MPTLRSRGAERRAVVVLARSPGPREFFQVVDQNGGFVDRQQTVHTDRTAQGVSGGFVQGGSQCPRSGERIGPTFPN